MDNAVVHHAPQVELRHEINDGRCALPRLRLRTCPKSCSLSGPWAQADPECLFGSTDKRAGTKKLPAQHRERRRAVRPGNPKPGEQVRHWPHLVGHCLAVLRVVGWQFCVACVRGCVGPGAMRPVSGVALLAANRQ